MYRAAATPMNAGFDFAGEAEKAARSVFVGNIPYEATEEQLKDIFSEVGVVVSFRLVYDRESGKPKGTKNYIRSLFFRSHETSKNYILNMRPDKGKRFFCTG